MAKRRSANGVSLTPLTLGDPISLPTTFLNEQQGEIAEFNTTFFFTACTLFMARDSFPLTVTL